MSRFVEYLTFRTMLSPILLQILFWAGIGGCVYGAWVLFELGNPLWLLPITAGPVLVRVIFERAILSFQSFDELVRIRHLLEEAGRRDVRTDDV